MHANTRGQCCTFFKLPFTVHRPRAKLSSGLALSFARLIKSPLTSHLVLLSSSVTHGLHPPVGAHRLSHGAYESRGFVCSAETCLFIDNSAPPPNPPAPSQVWYKAEPPAPTPTPGDKESPWWREGVVDRFYCISLY